MKLRNTTVAVFICALVACSAGQSTPSFNGGQTAASDSAQAAPLSPALAALARQYPQIADQLQHLTATPSPCTAGAPKLPGTYALMLAFDADVKNGQFTSDPSAELTTYIVGKFVKATPAPHQTPTPPKSTPTPVFSQPPGSTQTVYFYTGSYALNKYGQGCAYLITTTKGGKIQKEKGNAIAFAIPNFAGDWNLDYKTAQTGPLSIKIPSLGTQGGKGSITLLATKGGNLDTGTITLGAPIVVKF
jgi:hypothetical protein